MKGCDVAVLAAPPDVPLDPPVGTQKPSTPSAAATAVDTPTTGLRLLALSWVGQLLGYACVLPDNPRTVLCGLVRDNEKHDALRCVRGCLHPTLVLVSQRCRVPHTALCGVTSSSLNDDSGGDSKPPPGLKQMSPVEFSAAFALERLTSGRRTLDQLHTHIDTSSRPVMEAVAALLSHMQRTHYACDVDVLSLRRHVVDTHVMMDDDAYRELQIFKVENHPAGHHGIGKPKEGLSLFGVVCRARTTMGRALLRRWFLSPINDIDVLNHRLDAVAFLTADPLADNLRSMLRPIQCPQASLKKISDGNHTPRDWLKVYTIAYHYHGLLRLIHDATTPQTPKLIRGFENAQEVQHALALACLCETIHGTLDLDRSVQTNRYVVRAGRSADLDRYRALLESIPDVLTDVAKQELQKLPEDVAASLVLHVVYLPQFGYHLAVPVDTPKEEVIDKLLLAGWSQTFSTAEHIFFKNESMAYLDTSLGDVHAAIADLEAAIVWELEAAVREPSVVEAFASLGYVWQLDCVLSFAEVAVEMHWSRPTLTTSSGSCELDLRRVCHPLLQCVDPRSVVTNDVALRGQGPRVLVVTGANSSGKSILVRTVALAAYMAHIGCFVPAESAVIAGTIYAIQTCATSYLHRSFVSDLSRVSRILRQCPTNSIVVVDEFGKGTLAVDGVALLASTISEFLERGQECPLALFTTHYTEIFQAGFLPLRSSPYLDVSCMSVAVVEQQQQNSEKQHVEIRYLFTRVPGISGSSYALPCARRCGISSRVLERASYVAQQTELGLPKLPIDYNPPDVQRKRRLAVKVLRALSAFDFDSSTVETFHSIIRSVTSQH